MPGTASTAGSVTLFQNVLLLLAGITAAAAHAGVLFALPRGFDLTDEGYYLTVISYPALYPRVTQFGFILNPVFELLGHDIAAFRLFGHTVLIVLALCLFRRVSRLVAAACPALSTAKSAVLL